MLPVPVGPRSRISHLPFLCFLQSLTRHARKAVTRVALCTRFSADLRMHKGQLRADPGCIAL